MITITKRLEQIKDCFDEESTFQVGEEYRNCYNFKENGHYYFRYYGQKLILFSKIKIF